MCDISKMVPSRPVDLKSKATILNNERRARYAKDKVAQILQELLAKLESCSENL